MFRLLSATERFFLFVARLLMTRLILEVKIYCLRAVYNHLKLINLQKLSHSFSLAIITILFFAFTVHSDVNTNVSIFVQDENFIPLSNVHVIIKELSWGAISGWNGRLDFEGVPSGNYTLEASHIGYHTLIRSNVSIHTGSHVRLTMKLTDESIELPDAEVFSQQENIVTFKRKSITILPEYWLSKGARNIGEALRDLPGISILQGDGRQRISLRGSPSHAVEVTLDGIPISDAGTGIAMIDRVNIDYIQAINIDFSGLGGAVHLFTEIPKKYYKSQSSTKLTFDQASKEYFKGNIRLEKSISKLDGVIQLSRYSDRGNFKYRLDNGTSRSRIGNESNGQTGMVRFKTADQISIIDIGVYYDESHHGVPGLINVSPTPEATLDDRRISIGFHQTRKFDRIKLSSLALYSSYTDQYKNPSEQFDPYSGEMINHYPENNRQAGRRLGLKTTVERTFVSSSIQADYDFQSDDYSGRDLIRNSNTIGGTGLGSARRIVHNLSIMSKISRSWWRYYFNFESKISQKFILNRNLNNDQFTSPGIGISAHRFWGNQQLTLNAGWGMSFVAPSFNAVFLEENMFAVGNNKLKPERGENTNLGLQYTLKTENMGHISGYISAFRQHTEDLIIWKRNSFSKYYPDNEDEVSQLGIEINLAANRIKGFISLQGSYIYNRSLIETEGDINQGNIPPLIAKHSGSSRISFNYSKFVSTLSARWGGRRYSTASNLDPISTAGMGLPPYTIWDAYFIKGIEFNPGELSVQFGVDNLFDQNYRLIERSPMPGREYRIRTTFKF